MIYDISRPIALDTAVWPGDTPYTIDHLVKKFDGNAINLTQITFSPHTATHADAPFHFDDQGIHPNQLPLESYIGRVQVVSVARRSGGITPQDITTDLIAPVERVLFHTWVSDEPSTVFPTDFPYPSLDLIDWLAKQGCVLLGMDSPSVDDFNSKTLEGHHRLWGHGMVHLESLLLRDVPDGLYELIALPLKFDGICGSPVRAILRDVSIA